jgi:hypothetical protein
MIDLEDELVMIPVDDSSPLGLCELQYWDVSRSDQPVDPLFRISTALV